MTIVSANYNAGDTFYLKVQYDWKGSVGNDYTVKVYSKQNLEIKDERGNVNYFHMDGQSPSGFTWSTYRTGNKIESIQSWSPKSLYDIIKVCDNLNCIFKFVVQNPWTLFNWVDQFYQ